MEGTYTFRVDRDFEVIKNKINKLQGMSEAEKAASLRQSKLDNTANRFVIDKRNNMLHDRGCKCAKEIPDEYFDMSETYIPNMKTCKVCKENALIRKCVKWPSDLKTVTTVLNKMNAKYGDILKLSNAKRISIRAITSKIIELRVNADKWRIEISPDGYFRTLLHNNYIIEDHKRIIQSGFHTHFKNKHISFSDIVKQMTTYRSCYHVNKIIKAEKDALEMAPENDIGVPRLDELFKIPNVVRLKKFKLLYDRYMYIDTVRDYGSDVFIKRGIKAKPIDKITSNRIKYIVVICDIPKWQRSKIFSAMSEIKSKMLRGGFRDTYLCSLTMMQYLDKRKIKYTTRFKKKKK